MIPKIIHYSWFSGEQMPKAFILLQETWRKFLPDYEFKLWNAKALIDANMVFANEAASVKKWAFAADAIRVYAIYHYGGIWLDGDVAVYQSFDPFLNYRMFIGKENSETFQHDGRCEHINLLTSHCFGAEKGHPFLKDCVDYYIDRHFILSEKLNLPQGLRYDMRLMPEIHTLLAMKYGYQGRILDVDKQEVLAEDIHVFPSYFFDSPKYGSMQDVVCIHYHFHSWTPLNDGTLDLRMQEQQRKKDVFYYLFTWINKILAKKGIQIRVKCV